MPNLDTSYTLPDAFVDVDEPHVAVWIALRESDGYMTGSELVAETGFSTSTVYRALKRLESDGLVRSQPRVSTTADAASSEWQAVRPTLERPGVILTDIVGLLEAVPWEDVQGVSNDEIERLVRRLEAARAQFSDEDDEDAHPKREVQNEPQ